MTPFKAKYNGRCGICRGRVKVGDVVIAIAPTNVEVFKPYDHERQQGGHKKLVTTKVAHVSCKAMIEGTYED